LNDPFKKDYILNVIKSQESNYSKPTAIQCFCWPVLLSGRDIILVSNSGYGKHLAVRIFNFFNIIKKIYYSIEKKNENKYMLPALNHIKNQAAYRDKSGPSVLLITPYQPSKDDIYAKTKEYIDAAQIDYALIYDNDDKQSQLEKLKSRIL
jgi:superfamily II DNA/RNA helicase